jgi:hypothetical protein
MLQDRPGPLGPAQARARRQLRVLNPPEIAGIGDQVDGVEAGLGHRRHILERGKSAISSAV